MSFFTKVWKKDYCLQRENGILFSRKVGNVAYEQSG